MKKVTLKSLAVVRYGLSVCALAGLSLIPSVAFAGDGFVPKPYQYRAVGANSQATINLKMTDLFEYPDNLDATANLDEAGVKAEFEYKNESVVGLYKYEYYNYGKVQQLYLMKKGGYATGDADVTVKLTYNGKTFLNTLDIDVLPFMTKDDDYTVDLGETLTMPVLFNDDFMRNDDKAKATIEIIEQPLFGTATVKSGGDNKQDSIKYEQNQGLENYTFDKLVYKVSVGGHTSTATVTINIHKNAFASRVIDFLPAPGQFTNQLSKKGVADETLGDKGGMISLGAFGGYVIYGFDQPIKNDPRNPYGVDFTIRGNSFIANLYGVWTEPGAVQVCQDLNGNGKPDSDEPWYELAGSDYWLNTTKRNVKMTYYNPNYDTRYTVPWKLEYEDGNGNAQVEAGAVLTNQFHNQSYYPDPFDFGCNRDSLIFEGSIIRSSLDMSAPSYIEFYRAPAFGYCDNRGYNKTDLTRAQNPYFADERGNAGDGFDISWAVDKNGKHVELDHVDFVKVYCAGNANAGWLGEWSTEVLGIGITTPDPTYEKQDYYLNYIGITQLQVVRGQECQFQGFLFKNGRPSEEGTPKWSLSADSVGTIDQTGLFKATGKTGKTTIYFTRKETIPTDSINIEVVDLTSVLIDLEGNASTVSNDSTHMIVGETIYINAQCTDSRSGELNGTGRNRYIYETFDWTTSNPEVGTITNGSFRALKSGRTLLHARSKTNPELADSILVIVDEIPDLRLLNNPLRFSYYAPEGVKLSNEIFTAGNGSTVYMDHITPMKLKDAFELSLNKLKYKFTKGEYQADTLDFDLTHYGKKMQMRVPVIYGPDTKATPASLLYTDNNNLKAYRTEAGKVDNLIDVADETHRMVVDGGFAYIASPTCIYRFNTSYAECTHRFKLRDKDVVDKMVVARNILLVVSHTVSGVYHLDILYKTDLQLAKTFEVQRPVTDMIVSGDKVYLSTEKDGKGRFYIYELKNMVEEQPVILSEKGAGIATLLAHGDLIYGIRPYNPEADELASILKFNTKNRQSQVVETDGVQAYFAGVPVALRPMCGDSLFLANNHGFTTFDVEKNSLGKDIIYTCDSKTYPTEAVADTINNYTYIVYADSDAKNYKGLLFKDNTFAKGSEMKDMGDAPTNLSVLTAMVDNEAPKVGSRFSVNPTYCEEMSTKPSNITIRKAGNFTDKEGDFKIYLRGLEKHTAWMTQLDDKKNGDINLQAEFKGTVDNDSVVYFQVEAIDKDGASVKTDVAFTIKARIVKPIVKNRISNYTAEIGIDTIRIDLKDVFGYSGNTSGLTFIKEVVDNDNPDFMTDSIDTEKDVLILIPAKDCIGMANIKLRYTALHKTKGEKHVDTSFCVTITEKPVGLDVNEAVSFRVLTNPFKDYICVNMHKDGLAELYDIDGCKVKNMYVKKGENIISTKELTPGAYLFKFGKEVVKVLCK